MHELALSIAGETITPPSHIPNGGTTLLETLFQQGFTIFLFIGICLMMVYMIWGAIQWIMASGDKQKLTAATARVRWAIIGFIVLLLSYAIIGAVGYLFKVDLLKLSLR